MDIPMMMRRDERRHRMINDPDLTGDVLLFALIMDDILAARREKPRRRSFVEPTNRWIDEVEQRALGTAQSIPGRSWAQRVIGKDAPRYEPHRDHVRMCQEPMIRRDGPCGKRGTNDLIDYDPRTGEARWVSLCARHFTTANERYEQRRQEWIANGTPVPPPNRGGVLPRYFNANWDELYRWAAPYRATTKLLEPTPSRPQLRLVTPDGAT